METLSTRLRMQAEAALAHPAVIESGHTLSYRDMVHAMHELATRLVAIGIGTGSRVAVLLPNSAEFVSAFFAIAHVGGIVVPLNPALRAAEIAAILEDAQVSLVLTTAALRTQCVQALQATPSLRAEAMVLEPLAESCSREQSQARSWPAELATPHSPVLYLYSSGSTGRPKRVARNHFNLLYETDRLIAALQLTPQDRVLGVTPFSHINGLMRSMVAAMLSGATLVPLAQFERRAVGRAIQEHAITVFIGVPFMFEALAETRWPQPVDFASLRYCISSSAPLRSETAMRFHERYGIYVRQLYGCTETGTIAVNLSPQPQCYGDSVGTPLEGITVEIFSENRRQILSPGAVGEIGIKSPAAANEYPGSPEQTRMAFHDGYFFPGDIGRKDAQGQIYLVGRKSLFINRAGYKVNPYEIEEILQKHPKVQEAAVIGVDTEHGDQKIKAVIVPLVPCEEREVIEFCRDKMADFKVPSIIEFRTELPKSATGKLLRTVLV